MSGEIVFRDGMAINLSEVAQALATLAGVESADVRNYKLSDGNRIVGVLTVNDDSELTPGDVIDAVQQRFPKKLWPDQVLLTYQNAFGAASRRAA